MPASNRKQLKVCWCPKHNGQVVHYKVRQRCHMRQQQDRMVIDPISSQGDDHDMDIDVKSHDDELPEVDALCLRLYSDFVQHNSTQASVTANLQSWIVSVGHYLPTEFLENIPRTFKQLMARYDNKFISIYRIPVCPGGCSLLDEVNPSLQFVCDCNGSSNVPWRRTNKGTLVPKLEYITLALSEVIKSWYSLSYVDD